MRINYIIISTILLACLCIYLNVSKNPTTKSEKTEQVENEANKGELKLNMTPEEYEEYKVTYYKQRRKKIEQIVKSSNVPITFWGKITDVYGNAVPHAKVSYSIRYATDEINEVGIEHKANSVMANKEGLFIIEKARGDLLSIKNIEHKDYCIATNQTESFDYDSQVKFIPDEAKPIVFLMFPIKDLSPLVKQTTDKRINWDNQFTTVKVGKAGKEAELLINITKVELPAHRRFDWEYTIKIKKGKLLKVERNLLSLAPLQGYQETLHNNVSVSSANWNSTIYIHLIYCLPDKTYGRVELTLRATYGHITVVDYYNPSGGRLLEMGDNK